ncbi:MAG: glycoside hydrolase family 127 protein, partial [Lachnospiraceae bacterium]|nr:glycoside hydrolase family 127 protein [Lachnospiraceae bacterium]
MQKQQPLLSNIWIKDPVWQKKAELNARFIEEMDPDRVLAGFRKTAGIRTDAKPYGGWEDSLIAGHGLGHYFSALALRIAYLSGKDRNAFGRALSHCKDSAETIIGGLLECQEKTGSGFLSAAALQDADRPEIQFDALEGKAEAETWVPWYALHKVLQGLIDLWMIGQIEGADKVTLSLGDWVCGRVLSWDSETRKKVLAVEYGGMNDSLYQLYSMTGDERYRQAAKVFDEPELYHSYLGMANRLKGVHANATIPKIIGYLEGVYAQHDMYVSGVLKQQPTDTDERIEIAERFWELVVSRHMYLTGGIGDMEHFFADGMLDASRTQCNAESCCIYNMLKLSSMLFDLTGETKYVEYMETALVNARLGSMGPDGGYTYFNPMGTGYYRLYSPTKPEENPFWCCVGTGLEDFAGFSNMIFYADPDALMILQWISADLVTEEGIGLSLDADYEKRRLFLRRQDPVKKKKEDERKLSINLRIPKWIKNRNDILPDDKDYLPVELTDGEAFSLDFEMELRAHVLPDNQTAAGFTHGPFVICSLLGNEKWDIREGAGIMVDAPAWKVVFDAAVKSDILYGQTHACVLDREILYLPEGVTREDFFRQPE